MNNIVRINGKLYHDLWEKGGDKLLAVYCTLKNFKAGEIKYYSYTSKNNKKVAGLGLLRAKTNLSKSVLEKYVPVLIDMGLCFIDLNGDFVMLGGEKTKELYNSKKMVPIEIGKNLTETKYNCYKVKLKSEEENQLRQISIKLNRRDQLKSSVRWKSVKAIKKANKIEALYGKNFEIIDKTILSNQSYAKFSNPEDLNNKSRGSYIKRQLIKNNIISTQRRFEFGEKMSYGFYLEYKKLFFVPGMTYKNGRLAKELVASFQVIGESSLTVTASDISQIKRVRPLSHLSFDMIAWWSNS